MYYITHAVSFPNRLLFFCVKLLPPLPRGLIHSQVEAGQREEASKTCSSAAQLARKRVPDSIMDILKLQVSPMMQFLTLYRTWGVWGAGTETGIEWNGLSMIMAVEV